MSLYQLHHEWNHPKGSQGLTVSDPDSKSADHDATQKGNSPAPVKYLILSSGRGAGVGVRISEEWECTSPSQVPDPAVVGGFSAPTSELQGEGFLSGGWLGGWNL